LIFNEGIKMEPTNNPTPTVTPTPEPVQPVQPVAPAAPVAPASTPETPVAPAPEPVAPVTAPEPAAPVTPVPEPVAPASEAPAAPVAPVIAPGAPNPVATNPMFQQPDVNSPILDTSPITIPETPKAPDPIEEELKAPLTPAAPVPGSIGSAVSMPANTAQQPPVQSVSFTDPATQPDPNNIANNILAGVAKRKMSRMTVSLICTIIAIVIVGLGITLIALTIK
jgi:hypothetical protein